MHKATFGAHPDVLTYLGFANRKLRHYDLAESYYRQALAAGAEPQRRDRILWRDDDRARRHGRGEADARQARFALHLRVRRGGRIAAMGRGQGHARAIGAAAALLLCGASTPVELPLRDARWLTSPDLAADLTHQPPECRSLSHDAALRRSEEIGRIAFRAPLLLGGQAARVGLSCATCHRNGRTNAHFHFPGLSGRRRDRRRHRVADELAPRRRHLQSEANTRPGRRSGQAESLARSPEGRPPQLYPRPHHAGVRRPRTAAGSAQRARCLCPKHGSQCLHGARNHRCHSSTDAGGRERSCRAGAGKLCERRPGDRPPAHRRGPLDARHDRRTLPASWRRAQPHNAA